MKKNNLLKILCISFLVLVLLTWIVPVGSITSGTYTKNGVSPIGLVDLFKFPVLTFQTFVQYLICFVAIGAFYGVLNKLGCYERVVKKISNKYKKKSTTFVVITVLFFTIISNLTGETLFLFAFIPFFASILAYLGYSNLLSCMVTVGSILVGQISSTYGFTIAGYYANVLSVPINGQIFTKIVLFVLTTVLFIVMILKGIKKNKYKREDSEEIILLEKNDNKKSVIPFAIITIGVSLFSLVALYNWYYAFNTDIFVKFNDLLMGIKIGNYPIVANLLSGLSIIGFFGNYEFAITLFIASALLAWVYNVSLNEYIDGIKKGSLDILSTAVYATLANVIFTYMVSLQNGTMFETILHGIDKISNGFNALSTFLISVTGSLFYNDYYYVISSISSMFSTFSDANRILAGILSGAIYSLVMLVAPISLYLVAGLKYFNVSYKDWIKNIWKYVSLALVIVAVIVTIAYALV